MFEENIGDMSTTSVGRSEEEWKAVHLEILKISHSLSLQKDLQKAFGGASQRNRSKRDVLLMCLWLLIRLCFGSEHLA